jgi:hypothetical protein
MPSRGESGNWDALVLDLSRAMWLPPLLRSCVKREVYSITGFAGARHPHVQWFIDVLKCLDMHTRFSGHAALLNL